jgi:hypothetical protein
MVGRNHPPDGAAPGCWAVCPAIGRFAPEFHGEIAAHCGGDGACMARRLLDRAGRLADDPVDRPASASARRR